MPIPSAIRAVFFDAVGTLIHPTPSAPEVYAHVAARFGLVLSAAEIRTRFLAAFRAEEAVDRAANWVTSEGREEARWRRIVAETLPGVRDAEACFRELYEHYARPDAWVVDPTAASVFAELRSRGLILGLASNYDHRLEAVVEGHAELRTLRPHVVISSRVGHRKPSPDFFAEVVGAVGMSPGEALLVGDDFENDYLGARAVGMGAVLLDPNNRNPEVGDRIRTLPELAQEMAH
ncbi:HAD-IA family hydrolase [Limnoglobus roseus]|uniref:Phosphoglycolate phosphatase n=1 Tax=Limnoglobus roseus TaxID=2598579 RepID=A0A5C1AB91_9BACT|nr:HAD-IA family hydrolase [Limnoglobus roseus]QEL15286.1 Phosphoglycolate phosphatase [Limnoglobus roseus]